MCLCVRMCACVCRRQKERAVVEKEAVSFKVERKVKDIQV